MNVLAIETATPACAMALRTSEGEEFSVLADSDRHHTESLTPGLRDLLEQARLAPKAVDLVVVDRGPGLFTGLRVGIATAIGFALGASAALVGVTSLEVLANGAWRAGVRGTLVGAVDGRRGELFVQTFDLASVVIALDDPVVATPSEVAATWSHRAGGVTFTGDGVARYESDFRGVERSEWFDQSVPSPLVALGLGEGRTPETEIRPLYVREADATANFTTRERPS